jgi:hypothetical protein
MMPSPTEHDPPPPYTQRPTKRVDSDLPFVQELQQSSSAHPSTFTLPREDPSSTARLSRWDQLKADNEERKAKKTHVTHEQAARMVGHDKVWLEERGMGKGGENGWVKKGSGGCVVM